MITTCKKSSSVKNINSFRCIKEFLTLFPKFFHKSYVFKKMTDLKLIISVWQKIYILDYIFLMRNSEESQRLRSIRIDKMSGQCILLSLNFQTMLVILVSRLSKIFQQKDKTVLSGLWSSNLCIVSPALNYSSFEADECKNLCTDCSWCINFFVAEKNLKPLIIILWTFSSYFWISRAFCWSLRTQV